MKIAPRERDFSSRVGAGILALPFLLLPAACSSMAVEDLVPREQAASAAPRPVQPDGYPNLNIRPEAASPQLADDESRQLAAELTALRQRQAAGAEASQARSEEERLRRLARLHAARALEEIEASQ